jgi:hypothetical protein
MLARRHPSCFASGAEIPSYGVALTLALPASDRGGVRSHAASTKSA